MSTVDAAIIDYVIHNQGGGSGTPYTAGDAIDLTSNKIAVKYNTGTMELVNGALSAKTGSSGTTYTAGDAINIASNKISVSYDPDTMQLVNGKISALPQSGSGGTVLSAGDAINIANNKINVKYNTGTMELVNGTLSAKTSTPYTAGDAINIANNKIAVKYDPDTIQLKDGKISAKTGSLEGYATTEYVNTEIAKIPTDRISVANGSLRLDNQHKGLIYDATVGESGSFGIFTESTDNADINLMSHWNKTDNYKLSTFSMPDSAIRFYVETLNGVPQTNSIQFFKDGTIEAMSDAKKITIKAETVDIQGKFIHNGNELTSNKCPVPTEDVLTRVTGSQTDSGTFSDENTYIITLGNAGSGEYRAGNFIRIRNAGTKDIDSFIIVVVGTVSTDKNLNCFLINQSTGYYFPCAVYHSGDNLCFEFPCESGTYEEFTSSDTDTDVGVFINEQMSYNTLCTVVRYINHPTGA